MSRDKRLSKPSIEELKGELNREKYRKRYRKTLRATIGMLIVVAAAAVLAATIWIPIVQIYGSSMAPTLDEGDVVMAVKGMDFEPGDLVCFYVGNKLLVKRYIAGSGQWVDMDEEGNVTVDGIPLDEPYVQEKAFGDTNISLPYQVPENRIFVMGDHRETSVDSRNTAVGCIADEQIVGKLVLQIWPLREVRVFH